MNKSIVPKKTGVAKKTGIAKKTVSTAFGDIAYLEAGPPDKPPVLFVHGIPTSSYLWRHVMHYLQDDLCCFAPDLMGLGDTEPGPAATFDMDAQAQMLIDFMEAVGHPTFALVCHDQGGAAAQIIAARMPQRVRAFVITDSVCYDNWPVGVIRRYQALSQVPLLSDAVVRSGLSLWLETRTPLSAFRRGVYHRERLSREAIAEYLRPMRESRAGRERFKKFLLAGHPRYTQLAVEGLRRFEAPTLIVWAADDAYLSPSWGRTLLDDIPGAERMELVPFCGHFWQEERPAEFACHIGSFLQRHLSAPPAELTVVGQGA